jgi:hypothetical protein
VSRKREVQDVKLIRLENIEFYLKSPDILIIMTNACSGIEIVNLISLIQKNVIQI